METVYIPGTDKDFVIFIKNMKAQGLADMRDIAGKYRWVIKDGDVEYIARPESVRPKSVFEDGSWI